MRFAATFHLLAALVVVCGVAHAKNYCPPQPKAESEGEGSAWYIPESAFTKEAANKALQNLNNQISKGVKGRDFLIDNDLKMIKGYLFISYLEEHKRDFGTNDISLKNQFCEFLRNEAVVSH